MKKTALDDGMHVPPAGLDAWASGIAVRLVFSMIL
jgi:hypothetical protein